MNRANIMAKSAYGIATCIGGIGYVLCSLGALGWLIYISVKYNVLPAPMEIPFFLLFMVALAVAWAILGYFVAILYLGIRYFVHKVIEE